MNKLKTAVELLLELCGIVLMGSILLLWWMFT
jgi:hypothetical protein